MSRLPNWRHRLASYVSDKARAEFDPGQTDCALFAAGAVEAVTGHDPAQGHRGRYNTIQGGLRRLRKSGTTDHVAMAARLFAEIPVSYAQPGDLAVLASDDGPALGVVQGEKIYVMTRAGLGLVPLLSASRAFRVA